MSDRPNSPQDVLKMMKAGDIKIVDVKFTDLYGQWHHFSMPAAAFDADGAFEEGLGFDGSSIRGFKTIESSDMVLVLDPTTAFIDPICEIPTISLIGNSVDPISRERFSRDPRNVAERSVEYLLSTGIADSVFIGPEAEFFIFDEVSYESSRYSSGYYVNSAEAPWASADLGSGHVIPYKGGYFPVAPYDRLQDLRSEMALTMIEAGIDIEVHHHEVATAGQTEIDMRFGPLVQMADQIQMYKYIVEECRRQAWQDSDLHAQADF